MAGRAVRPGRLNGFTAKDGYRADSLVYGPADLVRGESVGAATAEDIRAYCERLANEWWMRPGMRFLADNRALSDVPPNRKFAGAALAAVRLAFSLRARTSRCWCPTRSSTARRGSSPY